MVFGNLPVIHLMPRAYRMGTYVFWGLGRVLMNIWIWFSRMLRKYLRRRRHGSLSVSLTPIFFPLFSVSDLLNGLTHIVRPNNAMFSSQIYFSQTGTFGQEEHKGALQYPFVMLSCGWMSRSQYCNPSGQWKFKGDFVNLMMLVQLEWQIVFVFHCLPFVFVSLFAAIESCTVDSSRDFQLSWSLLHWYFCFASQVEFFSRAIISHWWWTRKILWCFFGEPLMSGF